MIISFLLAAVFMHSPGESRLTMEVGGRTRSYVLYQPEGTSEGEPLVIALHGRLGTGAGMERLTHFERIAAREKFLLIYPDGVHKSWNDGRETPAQAAGVDDVAFIAALIDSAVRNCHADPKRIYVCGISNGGFMTMRLATALSDRIAAAAVVAATMDEGAAQGTGSTGQVAGSAAQSHVQPVSVLVMHGRKDPLVPYYGGSVHHGAGGPILSHDSAVMWWVGVDGCSRRHQVTEMILDSAGDGTTAWYNVYPSGMNGTEVVGYTIENGGHTWPGGWQYLPVVMVGRTSRNLDASEVIWAFFRGHGKQ